MKSVLIANGNPDEANKIKDVINQQFKVSVITLPIAFNNLLDTPDLVLLDHNFTEYAGIDFLMEILKKSYLPVLMVAPPNDARCAVDAMRVGAYNYIVKTDDYYELLNISIKEAMDKFNQLEQMKQTIINLKKRVNELEGRLEKADKEDVEPPLSKPKVNIIENIVSRFKQGEVNLPSLPQIIIRFKELIRKSASLQEIAELLKQDVAISSKLIGVSNSAYYRGVAENKTLGQAVSRLGLNTTKQYVEVVSNRSLYTTTNKKYMEFIEKLWEHSLSCAFASQFVSEVIKLEQPDEVFTMGLLHDIGKLILLQVIGEFEIKGKFGEEIDRVDVLNTLDANHNMFGATLLKKWDFSSEYVQIAMHHDNLSEANPISKELLVVHLANLLVKSMGYGLVKQEGIDLENAESISILNLNSTIIAEVKDKVKGHMDELKNIVG